MEQYFQKFGLTYEDIKCKISFDVNIELASGIIYTGNILLDLPSRKHTKYRNIKLWKNRI